MELIDTNKPIGFNQKRRLVAEKLQSKKQCSVLRVHNPKPSIRNLRITKGNGRAGNRRPAAEVALVRRNSKRRKEAQEKLSTKVGTDA